MRRRGRGPARWPLVVLAGVFFVLGNAALDDRGDNDDPAPTTGDGREIVATTTSLPSERVDGEPEPIQVDRADYALTYRVEGFTVDGGAIVDLERRWVRGPYASRVETVPAEDGEDAAPTFLQISDFGVLQTGREDEEPVVLRTEPAIAPGDVRFDIDVVAAIEGGVLEWRHEVRTVLDRPCQVFRAAGPVDVASLGRLGDDENSWADLCIADDGLLLQEEWVIDGEPFRRRTAVEIDGTPDLDDALFEPGGVAPEGPEAGTLAELTPDSLPPGAAYYALPEVPAGFRHRGRFGYSPPRAAIDLTQPEVATSASILDVYEGDDGRVVVVVNGGTSDNSATVEIGADDTTVDLGAIGTGELVLGLRENEVRAGLPRGRFLRVYGTLPAADLVALTRTLVATTDPNGRVTPKP